MNGNKVLNFALVGAGRMGERWAKIIAESKATRLVFVVDSNRKIGGSVAKIYGATFTDDLSSALSDANIDAIVVVTPHKYLFGYARTALIAGKHVFVEKPGSRTAKEMRELTRLAEQKKRSFMVGFNYRFFDAVRRAKKVVESGAIGTIERMRLRHGQEPRAGLKSEWRMDKEMAGGGVLMDESVHNFDLVSWFFNEPIVHVACVSSNLVLHTQVEESVAVVLKSASGKIASVNVSVVEWKPMFCVEIFGSSGYCRIDGVGRKYGGKELLTVGTVKRGVLKEKIVECDPDYWQCLRREFEEFIDAMRAGRQPNPGGADGLAVLEVVEQSYKSEQ